MEIIDSHGSFLSPRPSMQILDASGAHLADRAPRVLSGEFCRSAHFAGPAEVAIHPVTGVATVQNSLVRAQVPHLVTLLVYHSKFQMVPDHCEYFVYAPREIRHSVRLAFDLWRRWVKGITDPNFIPDIDSDGYPKVDDGAVSEPIDDAFFLDTWKYVRRGKHKCAGNPDDPFAFTSTDNSVKIYRSSDFQSGLDVTIG